MSNEVTGKRIGKYIFISPLLIGTTFFLTSLIVNTGSFLGNLSIAILGLASLYNAGGFFYYETLRGKPLPSIHLSVSSAIIAVGAFITMLASWGHTLTMISMPFVIIAAIVLMVIIKRSKRK